MFDKDKVHTGHFHLFRPIVPWLVGCHELLATSPESQRSQWRSCFYTVFYLGVLRDNQWFSHWVRILHVLNRKVELQLWMIQM